MQKYSKYKNQYVKKLNEEKFCMQKQCRKIENKNSAKCKKPKLCRMQKAKYMQNVEIAENQGVEFQKCKSAQF